MKPKFWLQGAPFYYLVKLVHCTCISLNPAKILAVRETQRPANVSELRSFLRITFYWLKFILDCSRKSEPLHLLTRADANWQWTSEHDRPFENSKTLLSSDIVISYCNPNKAIEVLGDASPLDLVYRILIYWHKKIK